MSGLGIFSTGPYHIITYGTLFGTTFWHSFVGGIVMFRTLARPQFAAVQSHLFPIYFSLQTAAPAILALTYPGNKNSGLGLSGILDAANRWTVLAPLATIFATSLLNLLVLLPATGKVMEKRRLQEKKDGKKSWEPAPHSQEMVALNKEFGKLHGISSLLNLTTFIASVVYGFHLGNLLQ
ncbi:hypothetical protein SAPIO_CDS0218 [Scedosporium apiospermum]|uniref:TMEM205-like domain-containing protein n=1 Tax=Pseudallescheria apiosperma TaxID=563466 RepID=A0A084GHS0_PSEDA|nr:uncharacterized protein SAPIO_CDS0218 [Scedosporium apiospermum]KEZ46882.1 hypothetical protein SAPIO_CDS0218 [Scedosporium apiospermum]